MQPVQEQADVREVFAAQKKAFADDPNPAWPVRADRLKRLKAMLRAYRQAFAEAIETDFGVRDERETLLAEVVPLFAEIREMLLWGRFWMRPQRPGRFILSPLASNRLVQQPRGVIANIAPWNYPLLLSLLPAVDAIAAGNRVMIKVSESVPRFAKTLQKAVSEYFRTDELAVFTGGAEQAKEICRLPLDTIIYTGGGAVGREVMASAAANLVPVILELGGKCPAVIAPDARFEQAVRRILRGKFLNAGQTCIAPDTVWVTERALEAFVRIARKQAQKLCPDPAAMTSIVNAKHFVRLESLVNDARVHGARVEQLFTGDARLSGQQMAPVLIINPPEGSRVLSEEIFGPPLLVRTYESVGDVIEKLQKTERSPLALYWFDRNAKRIQRVKRDLSAGGITVNDTLQHAAQTSMPFGGVGESGMGVYHGRYGFEALSRRVPVSEQSRLNGLALFDPPYGRVASAILRLLAR
ncbi:MAG: aldehyde dehydrogenase family protein [Duodenibacillus sp.]|nr:aldehyde dehydrogenase family protein [Duodenibacillus sp.]